MVYYPTIDTRTLACNLLMSAAILWIKELRALRGYFAPPPYEAKKWNSLFTYFFFISLLEQ